MSDRDLESDQLPSDAKGAAGGQPPSNNTEVPEHIRQYVERELQRQKDTRIHKIEKRQDAFEDRLTDYEEYRKSGMTPMQARKQMKIDALLEERENPQSSPQTFPARSDRVETVQPVELKPTKLFEVLGIDPNDNDALDIAIQNGGNATAMKAALVDYKLRGKFQAQPNAGAVVAPAGGAISTNEQAALRTAYEQEKSKIPRGGRAPDHLIALKQKYRKLGLAT